MVMIAHQAIRMELPGCFLASLSQRLQEVLPINVVQVDFLAPIAPAHDVIHGPWILDAHLPRHEASLPAEQPTSIQIQRQPDQSRSRLDPLLWGKPTTGP